MGTLGNLSWKTWQASMTWIFSEEHKPVLQRIWWVLKLPRWGPLVRVTWNCQGKLAVSLLGIKRTLLLDSFFPSPSHPYLRFPSHSYLKLITPPPFLCLLKVFPLYLYSWKDLFGRGSYVDRTVGALLCQLDNLQFWEPRLRGNPLCCPLNLNRNSPLWDCFSLSLQL